jgi:DNA-binding transcriptional MerR regulator
LKLGIQHLDKAPDAFRTISEVADDLDIPQHVLRFWETRFTQIKPMKRSGGRRYYRPDDVDLLRGIRRLLYGEGYTIRGVQRILKENGIKAVQGLVDGAAAPAFKAPRPDPKQTPVEDDYDDEPVEAEADIDEEDEEEAAPVVARREPEIAIRREPLMQARREPDLTARREPDVVPRREPELAPRPQAAAEPRPQPAPAIDHAARQRDRARLRAALEDLLACRQALDAAMKDERERD